MLPSKAAAKPRIQRLRASCDGCFLAKVKCSKARPICSRCLTCGTDCKYSPSSRAGKPKAHRANSNPNMSNNVAKPEIMTNSALPSPFFFDSNTITMASDGKNTSIFTFDTNWPVTCGPLNDGFSASLSSTTTPSTKSCAMMDVENALPFAAGDLFGPSFTWNQGGSTGVDHPIGHIDASMMFQGSQTHSEASQLSQFSPWLGDQKIAHYYPPPNKHSASNTFDSSCSTPEFSNAAEALASYCSCLRTCLQSLFALHEHSIPATTQPAFDVVLSINRKAVESCARMLACSSCPSASRSSTNLMLLATIMEKILSFYQDATRNYLQIGPETDPQMSIGTYQVTNEDGYWLKAEILWRELRKLEELLGQFSSACAGSNVLGQGETGVHSSLVNHLSQSLSFTFEVMKLQQTGFGSLQ